MSENNLNVFSCHEDKPIRKFKVSDDGNVEIEEVKRTVMKMSYREFVTFYRENQKQLENFKEQLSEENQSLIRDNISYIEKEIYDLKAIYEESERKTIDNYNRLKREGVIKRLHEELVKPKSDRNNEYLMAIVNNMSEFDKDIIMSELSDSDKHELAKVQLKIKQVKRKSK
jgi:hypothetical protein